MLAPLFIVVCPTARLVCWLFLVLSAAIVLGACDNGTKQSESNSSTVPLTIPASTTATPTPAPTIPQPTTASQMVGTWELVRERGCCDTLFSILGVERYEFREDGTHFEIAKDLPIGGRYRDLGSGRIELQTIVPSTPPEVVTVDFSGSEMTLLDVDGGFLVLRRITRAVTTRTPARGPLATATPRP